MNKHTLGVLTAITNTSKDGEATVMDRDDFLSAVPGITDEELNEIIKELALTECIKLRYHSGQDYCVSSLPKGKLLAENDIRNKTANATKSAKTALTVNIDYSKIRKVAFGAGFFGALLAGLLVFAAHVAFVLLS
ncbi:MAG: hypothetical protein LBE09_05145 [Christensenellaceae bacterium]|nr:hypothetical protein [Christensenellaceae bacterium]